MAMRVAISLPPWGFPWVSLVACQPSQTPEPLKLLNPETPENIAGSMARSAGLVRAWHFLGPSAVALELETREGAEAAALPVQQDCHLSPIMELYRGYKGAIWDNGK